MNAQGLRYRQPEQLTVIPGLDMLPTFDLEAAIMSAVSRKLLNGATKLGIQFLAKNGPLMAAQAVRQWNQLVLRGECERARAEIRREFNQNREVARAVYLKYEKDMQIEVRNIFATLMSEQGDA